MSRSSNQKRKRKARVATGVPCSSGRRNANRLVGWILTEPSIRTAEQFNYILETGRLPPGVEIH